MKQPKFYRGNPVIQPNETYEIDGVAHKVITATSSILGFSGGNISMTNPVFHLDNLETGERVYMSKKELASKFVDPDQLLN